MEGLGLGLGLGLDTKATPVRVINLTKRELEELQSRIDDGQNINSVSLKIKLLGVIDALLSNKLPNTDYNRVIINLEGYKYALEHERDDIEAIRSALLGEFIGLLNAAQAGGKRRARRSRSRNRTKRRRTNRK